jgi:hypothetical protein
VNHSSGAVSLKPSLIVRLVGACVAHARIVIALLIILCIGMGYYVTRHFAMSTDIDALLSHELPWRVRQAAFDAAFAQNNGDIVVVVDGQTPELSEAATATLAARLATQTRWFHSVVRPDSGPFWEHNGLLFASTQDVKKVIAAIPRVHGIGPLLTRSRQYTFPDHARRDP